MKSQNKTQFELDLEAVLSKLSKMLIEKNNNYGDAALNPSNTFSKLSAREAILIRCDDKLARLRNNQDGDTEDPEFDLWGYLTLLQILDYREKNPSLFIAGYDPYYREGNSLGEVSVYKTKENNHEETDPAINDEEFKKHTIKTHTSGRIYQIDDIVIPKSIFDYIQYNPYNLPSFSYYDWIKALVEKTLAVERGELLDHTEEGGEPTSVKTQKIGFLDVVTPKRQIDIENEKKQAHYDRSRGIFPE